VEGGSGGGGGGGGCGAGGCGAGNIITVVVVVLVVGGSFVRKWIKSWKELENGVRGLDDCPAFPFRPRSRGYSA
jgi:predicted metalloprotease